MTIATLREQFEYDLWQALRKYELSPYRQTEIGRAVLELVDTYVQLELAAVGETGLKRRDRIGKIHYFAEGASVSYCGRVSLRNCSGYSTDDPAKATCGHCRIIYARHLTGLAVLATLEGSG